MVRGSPRLIGTSSEPHRTSNGPRIPNATGHEGTATDFADRTVATACKVGNSRIRLAVSDKHPQETVLPNHISRDDLHQLILDGQRPVLVEALGVAYYTDAHLPGAINIPPGQVDRLAPALLPDRRAPIVVYCTHSGTSSDTVAKRLEQLGYSAVAVYRAGKEDWVEHGLPLERPDTDAE
jgi:rhodanese-related sulfurtransferase